jgi:transposase
MAERFVNIDRETPMLLPPDLREWVAENELARFVLEAVELSDLRGARVNGRGSGSAQYPPGMMMAVLVYCYANGLFSSRRIERASFESVAVRYLCGNEHPDHDTIAKFRRENLGLVRQVFVRVLELARELGLLQLGTVSIDGSKVLAAASKRANRSGRELEEELAQIAEQVEGRLCQAEAADQGEGGDPTALPQELADRATRQARLRAAQEVLQAREQERAARKEKGEYVAPPSARGPQVNLSDPQSGLMPTSQGPFVQGYNVQAVVEAEGHGLIVGARVTRASNDRQQLQANVESIPEELGAPTAVLADSGYDDSRQIAAVEQKTGARVYCPPQRNRAARGGGASRRPNAARQEISAARERMRQRLESEEGRRLYARRQVVSEPVFAAIKNVLGFRRFSMRGLQKSEGEWQLVALAYNCRKLSRKITPRKGRPS